MSEEPFTYPIARFRNRKVRLLPPGSTGGGGGGAGGSGPGISGQWVTIATVTVANVANVDFTNLSAQYVKFEVTLENIIPVVDNVFFQLLTSSDNGVTFASAANSYDNANGGANDTFTLCNTIAQENTAATGAGFGTLTLFNPRLPAYVGIQSIYSYQPSTAVRYNAVLNGGIRTAFAEVNAIRFRFASGAVVTNIATGTFRLRGQLP